MCQSLFFSKVEKKRETGTSVFLWILRNFQEHLSQNASGRLLLIIRLSQTVTNSFGRLNSRNSFNSTVSVFYEKTDFREYCFFHALIHFMPLVSFYTLWKQKTSGFLMFSGDIERVRWRMKWVKMFFFNNKVNFEIFVQVSNVIVILLFPRIP